jgi:hypothetical protein
MILFLFNMILLNDDGATPKWFEISTCDVTDLLWPHVSHLIFHSKWSSFIWCPCLKVWSSVTYKQYMNK